MLGANCRGSGKDSARQSPGATRSERARTVENIDLLCGMEKPWQRIYGALFVKKSAIVGRGLYTRVRIPKRAKLGEFGGERIGLREARRRAKGREIVAIVELDKFAYDATVGDNAFRWINHSCEPNTYIRTTATRAEFYALRGIRPGEELTADYVDSHHNGTLRCRCGAKKCRGFI